MLITVCYRVFTAILLIALTACSGGGGGTSPPEAIVSSEESELGTTSPSANDADADADDNTNNNAEGGSSTDISEDSQNASSDSVLARYDIGDLTASDAGSVARTIVSALTRRIQNRSFKDATLRYEPANLITTQSVSEAECSVTGRSISAFNVASQWLDADDANIRVLTTGDHISSRYEDCQGLLGTQHLETFDGQIDTHFLSGYASQQGGIYSETASVQQTYDRMTYFFAPLVDNNYQHGAITTTYDANNHSVSGTFYTQRVAVIDDTTETLVEQIITTEENFQWQVTEGDTPSLNGSGRLGSDLLESSFDLTIDQGLIAGSSTNTGWSYEIINGGAVTAAGTVGQLQIEFYQEYIRSRFDGNGDGDFESATDLFWYDILPTSD